MGMVEQRLCTKMGRVCRKGNVPLWPEGKPRMNEQFKPKDEQDLKLEEMVATMAGDHGTGITMMKPGEYDLRDGTVTIDEIDVLKEEL